MNIALAIIASGAVLVSIYAVNRQGRLAHHQWLADQRLTHYSDFFNAIREYSNRAGTARRSGIGPDDPALVETRRDYYDSLYRVELLAEPDWSDRLTTIANLLESIDLLEVRSEKGEPIEELNLTTDDEYAEAVGDLSREVRAYQEAVRKTLVKKSRAISYRA